MSEPPTSVMVARNRNHVTRKPNLYCKNLDMCSLFWSLEHAMIILVHKNGFAIVTKQLLQSHVRFAR